MISLLLISFMSLKSQGYHSYHTARKSTLECELNVDENSNTYRYENITVAKKKNLERIDNRIFFNVSTTDDENIEEFAHAGKGNVFATDMLMAHLMACARSVRPWDMIIQRVGTGENKVCINSFERER